MIFTPLAMDRRWQQHGDGWTVAFHHKCNSSVRYADLTMSTCPACDRTRGQLRWDSWEWHPLAQKLLVNSGNDRRERYAPAGKMKLNPVSLNAPEMMRLLHFCADLFILSPCLPFIYYVEALTFSRLSGRQVKLQQTSLGQKCEEWLLQTATAGSVCLKLVLAVNWIQIGTRASQVTVTRADYFD